MEENNKLQLNNYFELIDKLLNWKAFYLFEPKEKWGTEYDWRIFLNPSNPQSSAIVNFTKLMLSTGVLIKNNIVVKQNKSYTTYKLTKKFEEKIMVEMIEMTPEFIWLQKYYNVYDKSI